MHCGPPYTDWLYCAKLAFSRSHSQPVASNTSSKCGSTERGLRLVMSKANGSPRSLDSI